MKDSEQYDADRESGDQWIAQVKAVADPLLMSPAESWYTGANSPGKPRVFMVYLGSGRRCKQICDDIAADGYRRFPLTRKEQQALAFAAT